ncbi:MAG: PQQ-binding-like beta-propeller repeat protein [Proteobacteria bacterium]|nr:PQQ-binding-like beta-propeller repeat protein [Pseudomonadota bacterium]
MKTRSAMKSARSTGIGLVLVGLSLWQLPLNAADDDGTNLPFTQAQATQGKLAYEENCASCHGFELEGFGLVPSLSGSYFADRWGDVTLDLLALDVRRMPPSKENSLSQSSYIDILAYVLMRNGLAAGQNSLPENQTSLSALTIPAEQLSQQRIAAANPLIYSTDGPLKVSSRAQSLSLVSDAMLQNPSADDWLIWRRTGNNLGHSPLDQITRDNVDKLQLAWSWALPSGANMMAPIVHDGVLFAYSFGDVLQAFDAATGELLWGFQRQLDDDTPPDSKKGVAIYADKIIMPTSDMHLIAIDARTGKMAWDHKVDTGGEDGHWFKSAPMIANGKAIIGLTGRQAVEGGDFILAVDMETGAEVWRFYTIARPDAPGGDTWNGLPLDQRTGGSVWIPGSFDAELNLVYFGPAPTYDTERLRQGPNDSYRNNDALYTNSTVALDADTGELAWHYQHARNDQLDHDWAYERQIIELPVNGSMRKVVVTGGKLAIFEALDAATGEYLFSIDLDMQNVVAEIDPTTGNKSLFPTAIPALDDVLSEFSLPGICPDWLGARNMQSTAYNPATRTLYIPLSDTCLDDETDQRWQKYPDSSADGSYGIIKAVNLESKEVVWSQRQTGPQAAANLTTATGLLFIGSVDRWFKALDQDTGQVLWERRLDNALNSYPITYRVDGKQYVAVATNSGGIHTRTMRNAAGINLPPSGATLWVFALPD